ncbi:MAG: NAD(+) synthase [Lachnospiraceae bacterium]|nr:NAD(+) synthase [Lachnospiraceae bacterium]
MKQGFVKVAAVTPKIKVADPVYNAEQIKMRLSEAYEKGAKIIVFPELCLTGYTCGELFLQDILLEEAKVQLQKLADFTDGHDSLVFVGLPFEKDGLLYNVAAALQDGMILGLIPKMNIPAHAEFYEGRHFTPGEETVSTVFVGDEEIPFGGNLLFEADGVTGLTIGCEICEDLWVPNPPSTAHAMAGATLLVNLSASSENVGKDAYREMLVKSASARLVAGYVYAGAGEGESTQDMVFGGHNIIAENGTVLVQAKRFANESIYSDIDVGKLRMERRKMTTFSQKTDKEYLIVPFALKQEETILDRTFSCMPFVPEKQAEKEKRCEEILSIQAYGLKKRYEHTGCKKAVIGVSGGLDSTLALLVTVRTFDLLEIPRENILAITMPCFGTTDRTYDNACRLARTLGASLLEINIKEAVKVHFADIGQDMENHDVTYENSQARERTQVLMDVANKENALVIGTGDMSELALGFATYNGDHMSMYGVNAGVPKTLMRHLVRYYADTCGEKELSAVLTDVLDTPVSPELLPPVDGVIAQRTEELVGPYELHDFFLYYMLRCGYEPAKVYRVAKLAFKGQYADEEILKWLKLFYRRFFTQQFKRSCLPDGPKVGSVGVSPRGDLRMPSDASAALWLSQIETL